MEIQPAVSRPMFSNAALRQLIVPLILEQLLAMTVGLAAVVMITSVGEAAVSGVSLVDSISVLFISVLSALCSAFGGVFTCNANKSECTVGYGTMYGDIAGFFAALADSLDVIENGFLNFLRTQFSVIGQCKAMCLIPNLLNDAQSV